MSPITDYTPPAKAKSRQAMSITSRVNQNKVFLHSIKLIFLSQEVSLKLYIMNSICRKSLVYKQRIHVPDDKVSWNIPWPEYLPQYFISPHAKDNSWSDPDVDNLNFKPKWNDQDGGIDRRSYDGEHPIIYEIVDGYPLNPKGRTGLRGRGKLGRWGPNHAGDALVTRWKRNLDKSRLINVDTKLPVLQFLAIKRKDCGKWAIPGGFVNNYEESHTAVVRELFEEAINQEQLSQDNANIMEKFLSSGKQVYKGYVDDSRNTDNAWIETTACNFHDETGEITNKMVLEARDDAADVKWIDIMKNMDIYETHIILVESVNNLHLQPQLGDV